MKKQSQTILIALCVLFAQYTIKSQGQHSEVFEGNPGAYLLITSESLADSFQPLVDRRASQGFLGELITIEAIDSTYTGVDIQEKVRNCIKDHYDPCTPLFVALGGDESIVPVRYCLAGGVSADLYYADIDGGSWDLDEDGIYGEPNDVFVESIIPEAYFGRIPVREPYDVSAYIEKVIRYETVTPDNFSRSMLCIGGRELRSGNARPLDFRYHDPVCATEIKLTRDYLQLIQPYWQAAPLHLFFKTLTSWDESCCGDYLLTADNVIYRISQGYHFVIFHGHSGAYNWSLRAGVPFNWDHASRLVNHIPHILWSGGCSAARYDGEDDPTLSEAFIRNPHGGAVAVFGHARSVGPSPNRPALWCRIFQHRDPYLGQAFANALASKAPEAVEDNKRINRYMFTFLGDPAIKLRLDEEPGRKIQLFSPNGCEIIDPNDTDITIRWNAQGTDFSSDDMVKLEYSLDSGASWLSIPGAEALPYNSRAFTWQAAYSIPYGTNYRIRASLIDNPTISSESNKDFMITNLGLLSVKSVPYAVWISGTHPGDTNYTFSTIVGETVMLTAPATAGEYEFICWSDEGGRSLSHERTYEFTFEGDTTVIARYVQPHYYVNDEIPEQDFAAGDDLNDGLSPQTPKRHIQSILNSYPDIGWYVIIHISKGTYPENINLNAGNNGLMILGSGSENTIIDGQLNGSCLVLYHCDSCSIKGLTLSNGYAANGGGMFCQKSSPTVEDCKFVHNTSSNRGGGLYALNSTPKLVRCTFSHNSAKRGGGITNIGSDTILTNCILSCNSSQDQGGGIYNRGSNSTLINCTLSGNTAGGKRGIGSAIFNKDDSKSTLINCIVWDNPGSGIEGPIDAMYSNIQGAWSGQGNILVDPLFVAPDNGDYHLKSQAGRWDSNSQSWIQDDVTSLCIDAGDPNSPIDDEPSPNGNIINMGAYGGTAEASKSPAG